HAALQRRHALLRHVGGGVHDAGVNVARHLQIEQVGAMLGVVEGVGGGLVDRHSHGLGGRVRAVAGVDSEGFGFHATLLATESKRPAWENVRYRSMAQSNKRPVCLEPFTNAATGPVLSQLSAL